MVPHNHLSMISPQQAAINSIGGGGADGTHVQVQTVPLGAAQVHQVQGTTTGGEVTLGGHGVVGGGGGKQQVLQIGTIGGNQLVLHPISSQDSNTVTLITNNTPNSFEFRYVSTAFWMEWTWDRMTESIRVWILRQAFFLTLVWNLTGLKSSGALSF